MIKLFRNYKQQVRKLEIGIDYRKTRILTYENFNSRVQTCLTIII